ncbi:MAG: 5-formyltetrahydrofolate cyclo-ligase [Geobacteraceae bacterium]|nr:5-formyltetrahydrofolate cyclo-ligase [Geobacteraceae bacterium]
MPKKALRRDLLARRRAMDQATWHTASASAQQRLADLELFQRAACIALYSPIQQEVDTELLFATARSAGKQVLYPLVCGNNLQFREVTETGQRASGAFGILEPCRFGEEHSLASADLIVVPGVAFDLQGHRIGFGKGYYDRCLSQLPKHGTLVGLCHDFQLLEQVPAERHDIRMQYVVTDKRIVQVVTGTMPD